MTQDDRVREALDRAVLDRELLAAVPPVVAFGFGVIPIQRSGTALTVACSSQACRDALRLLRPVLDREVVATPVDERSLLGAIDAAYSREQSHDVNFPTFDGPDFLARKGVADLLRVPKVERLGPTGSSLDAGTVVLGSFTYHGRLFNVEHPKGGGALPDLKRTRYHFPEGELAWTLEGGSPVLWGAAPGGEPPPSVWLDEYRFSDHRSQAPGTLQAEHVARGHALAGAGLPFVIHATEVQLVRVEADGTLVVHAYDREERFSPGAPERRVQLRYFFLSFGQRLHREIDLTFHEVLRLARGDLRWRPGSPRWGPRELGRFLATGPAPGSGAS